MMFLSIKHKKNNLHCLPHLFSEHLNKHHVKGYTHTCTCLFFLYTVHIMLMYIYPEMHVHCTCTVYNSNVLNCSYMYLYVTDFATKPSWVFF